ncbi:MAG TPA: transcription termination/antitermination protein NusA [Deltaproteobacteria bacterium]|nr:MAG: transcription termination/antitermination protein NusA [Deltaproteobacteria bacterium]HDM75489.1 transcription termination/antitermination protein NusA [Deltaproteobacteria bacterium]
MISELKRLIDQVSRDKGIDRNLLISTLEDAIRSAAKKKFGKNLDLEVAFNEEYGEIEAFQFKEVVKKVRNPETEISLEEARRLDPECELNDSLGIKIDTNIFGRIAAQVAKQIIIQKMKDAEREAIYEEFHDRKGEIVNGIVQRVDKTGILVNLGRAEALLPPREQVPREVYRPGDRIRAYILDVKKETKGPQIILSRTHPNFLIELFKTEVPEIAEGIVTIKSASREPGNRAKIAVASREPDIDPVGACVGMKGSRVQSVVQELRGEKIDIIEWNADPAKFVCNALAPAIISRVIIDQMNKAMEVIVPDDQLSLAIGKRGQNVRLASKLTGWKIDVKGETAYQQSQKEDYKKLQQVLGSRSNILDKIFMSGVTTVKDLANMDTDELTGMIEGLDEEEAKTIIERAKEVLESAQQTEEETPDDSKDEKPVEQIEEKQQEEKEQVEA